MRRVHAVILFAAIVAANACNSSSRATPFCEAVERLGSVKLAPPVNVAVDHSMSDAEIDARVRRGRDELASAMAEAGSALAALRRTATAEVDADVNVVVSADQAYLAAITNSDFDLFAATQAARIEDPEVAAAESRIDAHARANCGRGFQRLASAEEIPGTTSMSHRPRTPPAPTPRPPAPRPPVGEPPDQTEAPVVERD